MRVFFVEPGVLELPTGGHRYDRLIAAAARVGRPGAEGRVRVTLCGSHAARAWYEGALP